LTASKIVTLTTDFGLKDAYVSEMKGVILGICPTAIIVDITHDVRQFDIRNGAYMMAAAAPYFPNGTVHVGIVDPGVGTERHPLILETKRGFFIGPDNGLMIMAAEAQGIEAVCRVTSRSYMLSHVSGTFHGRDIFAPIAAHLLNGIGIEEFGPPQTEFVKPTFSIIEKTNDSLVGEILHVDNFGNIITNISYRDLNTPIGIFLQVKFPRRNLKLNLVKSYGEAKVKEPLALINSHNYLEIALNQGNAAANFEAKEGDRIVVSQSISTT
jgi:S-adenosylmethionine hydrolase